MKKRAKKKKEKFPVSNRVLYTFITVAVIAIVAFGVYALTPGVAPNPGHLITQIAPPSPCNGGQFLQFNGNTWVCNTTGSGSGSSPWTQSGTSVYYNGGNVGIGASSPQALLDIRSPAGVSSANGLSLYNPYGPAYLKVSSTDFGGLGWGWNIASPQTDINGGAVSNNGILGLGSGTKTALMIDRSNSVLVNGSFNVSNMLYVPGTSYTNYGICSAWQTTDALACPTGYTTSNVITQTCTQNADNFNYIAQQTCTGTGSYQPFTRLSIPNNSTHLIIDGEIHGGADGLSPYIHGSIYGLVGSWGSGKDHTIGTLPSGYDANHCMVFLQGFSDEHCDSNGNNCVRIGAAGCGLNGNTITGYIVGDNSGTQDGNVGCGYICW